MRDKAKKTTKEIKLRDLKPVKDAKAGLAPPCRPGNASRGISLAHQGSNHNEVFLTDAS